MDFEELCEDFEILLGRYLSLFEVRMIRRSYYIGLANGVKLISSESIISSLDGDDLVGDDK